MIKFEKIVLFTSIIIAICAASFSIYGIGLLFSGATIAAMIMASTLELGKLVTTSWLFRNWKIANVFMKAYMTFAIIMLMGITSLGVFGYLSSAYQKSSLENEMRIDKIKSYEHTIQDEYVRISNFEEEIQKLYTTKDAQSERLSETLNNPIIARNPIQLQNIQSQINSQIESISQNISDISNKIEISNKKITDLNQSILEIKLEQSSQKDITTFTFAANELNTGIDDVAKWFIFLIIAVFDPLAVVLLMAATSKYEETSQVNTHQNSCITTESSQVPTISTESVDSNTVSPVANTNIQIIYGKYKIGFMKPKAQTLNNISKELKSDTPNTIVKEVTVIKEIEKPIPIDSQNKGMFSF